MFRRIVCPTDFSAPARKAATYAAGLAKSCGAELVLLHVVAEIAYPMRSLGTVTAFPNLQEELHRRAADELEDERKLLGEGVTIRTEMRDGEVHEQILESAQANSCDLIVIGTHGHTGLKHMLLGSTAERVVRMSEVPVLTVRTSGD
ncbi:MAG: universal stress protein [Planctomycetes bacterium]|nr:universal stress protein [Planctomycetota bacterium]